MGLVILGAPHVLCSAGNWLKMSTQDEASAERYAETGRWWIFQWYNEMLSGLRGAYVALQGLRWGGTSAWDLATKAASELAYTEGSIQGLMGYLTAEDQKKVKGFDEAMGMVETEAPESNEGNYGQFLKTLTALENRYHALLVVADSLRAIAAERRWWELKWRPEERGHSTSFRKKDATQ